MNAKKYLHLIVESANLSQCFLLESSVYCGTDQNYAIYYLLLILRAFENFVRENNYAGVCVKLKSRQFFARVAFTLCTMRRF